MLNLGLLLLRLVLGGLLVGHGAQKLFGSFGGHGLAGTAGFFEKLGLRPGHVWAWTAGFGEFGGGLLTALGFVGPLGPITMMTAMTMAAVKAHWGKPIWVTSGGAELPLVNIAAATLLALSGPGTFSLDRLFGLRVPRWLTTLFTLGAAGTVIYGTMVSPEQQEEMASSVTQAAA